METRIVSFMNQKGGVGKTTTAFHFAAFLKEQGKKVLCIDLDSQGSLSFCFGAKTKDKATVYEFLTGETSFDETVQRLPYGDILPADAALGIYSIDLEGKYKNLAERLTTIKEHYDFILCDCPPGINVYNYNALSCATDVVITVQANPLSMLGLPQVFTLIKNSEELFNRQIKITGILITMFNSTTRIAKDMREQLKEIVGEHDIKVYETAVKKLSAIETASAMAQTVFDFEPQSQAAKLYRKACNEILHSINQ